MKLARLKSRDSSCRRVEPQCDQRNQPAPRGIDCFYSTRLTAEAHTQAGACSLRALYTAPLRLSSHDDFVKMRAHANQTILNNARRRSSIQRSSESLYSPRMTFGWSSGRSPSKKSGFLLSRCLRSSNRRRAHALCADLATLQETFSQVAEVAVLNGFEGSAHKFHVRCGQ